MSRSVGDASLILREHILMLIPTHVPFIALSGIFVD